MRFKTNVGLAEGDKAFTRLDLVKHVLNTLIASLTEFDSLSLITFSDDSKILLDLIPMNFENKCLARKRIAQMRTEGSEFRYSSYQSKHI